MKYLPTTWKELKAIVYPEPIPITPIEKLAVIDMRKLTNWRPKK